MLQFIHNNVWKMLFGKMADGLQKSTDDEDEYRIIEGILNSADFRCKVSAFFFEQDGITKTLYIIKFDKDVINRDSNMK